MSPLEIKTRGVKFMELNGLYGNFYVGKREVLVHYFSTYATPNPKENDHFNLLEHLEPMRQRVSCNDLKDLDSLLQRDLSDERIASDLIPYLRGSHTSIGFFPPILAVVLPKGFINTSVASKKRPVYPKGLKVNGIVRYAEYWQIKQYEEKDNLGNIIKSRLSMLSVDTNNSDIIVIDGQHRANAFRYAAKSFDPQGIYRPFYAKARPIDNYMSDLPVTIIWFESVGAYKIKPNDISKELFVAVNNNAKRVSRSRTILLDENDIISLGVNTYYKFLAKNRGFNADKMNLLVSGFDIDSELTSAKQPKMVLTNPEILYRSFIYSFFGNSSYDNLKERATKAKQDNETRFKSIFGTKEFYNKKEAQVYWVKTPEMKDKFINDNRKGFEPKYIPVLNLLFDTSKFTGVHYQSVKDLEKWIDSQQVGMLDETWSRIFKGGEGLYTAYMTSTLSSCKTQKKHINEINKKYMAIRADNFRKEKKCNGITLDDVNKCYETFNTIAYQTGFLMSFDYIAKHFYANNVLKAVNGLSGILGNIDLCQWKALLVDFKKLYIPSDLDPNSWPKFEKMLLKLLTNHFEIFEGETEQDSPEYPILQQQIKMSIEGYYEANENLPKKKMQLEIRDKHIEKINAVCKRLDVKIVKKSNLRKQGDKFMRNIINDFE